MEEKQGAAGPARPSGPVSTALAYSYGNGLYINLTSRCPTACRFCIKFSWDYRYRGYDLRLPADPSVRDILDACPADLSRFSEVVFCGYGESTYRLDAMAELAAAFRRRGARRIRLNTVGLGNLINGRSIAADLAKSVDAVSISLNTVDPAAYREIMRPLPEFRDRALDSVRQFVRECARAVPDTTVTAVRLPGIDVAGVRALAEEAGARFRLRDYLDEYQPT